jgi:urea carboxylase
VRFVLVDEDQAGVARAEALAVTRRLRPPRRPVRPITVERRDGGVIAREAGDGDRPDATYRRAGDEFLLVEYGPMALELGLRARIHALEGWLSEHGPDAIVDTTAGVRSLLVHFDPDLLPSAELLDLLRKGDDELPATSELVIPSRTVHLPLSWEDPATLEAIRRYMAVVRDDAPWCPSNLDFIRRINGLDHVDDVHRIVFDARYLVLGLGDVYLGAPVATPVDPRHRLVTTKYNPARTWTPENAVGIGGAYLCVYGMEGPGGYQFVGRTVPVWYLDQPTPGDDPDTPWLLRTFDQLRFHPVTAEELVDLRGRARAGELEVAIEPTTFSLADHEAWLAAEADDIDAFRAEQHAAFDAERRRWIASGELR